jgi:hypothetical protein
MIIIKEHNIKVNKLILETIHFLQVFKLVEKGTDIKVVILTKVKTKDQYQLLFVLLNFYQKDKTSKANYLIISKVIKSFIVN